MCWTWCVRNTTAESRQMTLLHWSVTPLSGSHKNDVILLNWISCESQTLWDWNYGIYLTYGSQFIIKDTSNFHLFSWLFLVYIKSEKSIYIYFILVYVYSWSLYFGHSVTLSIKSIINITVHAVPHLPLSCFPVTVIILLRTQHQHQYSLYGIDWLDQVKWLITEVQDKRSMRLFAR